MKRILFLCTGNSCRSQMAEGFARELLGNGQYQFESAGIEAHGLKQRAIIAMAEVGIDITGQSSTVLTEEQIQNVHAFVTVCGDADRHCPTLPATTRRLHWSLGDPAMASGDEQEIAECFRRTRDEIRRRTVALVSELNGEVECKLHV